MVLNFFQQILLFCAFPTPFAPLRPGLDTHRAPQNTREPLANSVLHGFTNDCFSFLHFLLRQFHPALPLACHFYIPPVSPVFELFRPRCMRGRFGGEGVNSIFPPSPLVSPAPQSQVPPYPEWFTVRLLPVSPFSSGSFSFFSS